MATYTVTTLKDEKDDGATVDNPGGTGLSLREAIALSLGNDVVTFRDDLAGGTIELTQGQIEIFRPTSIGSLTIDGNINNDHLPDITIDAQDQSRVISINPGSTSTRGSLVTLDGLAVTRGKADIDAGISVVGNPFILINSTVSNNNSDSRGGGGLGIRSILVGDRADVDAVVMYSTISGNTANDDNGGGIDTRAAKVAIFNSTISNNSANSAGVVAGGGRGRYISWSRQ